MTKLKSHKFQCLFFDEKRKNKKSHTIFYSNDNARAHAGLSVLSLAHACDDQFFCPIFSCVFTKIKKNFTENRKSRINTQYLISAREKSYVPHKRVFQF